MIRVIKLSLLFSGFFNNVRQMGIEFHAVPQNIRLYFGIMQQLYKLGFVTISWDPNLTTIRNLAKGPFEYFEIVLRRPIINPCI